MTYVSPAGSKQLPDGRWQHTFSQSILSTIRSSCSFVIIRDTAVAYIGSHGLCFTHRHSRAKILESGPRGLQPQPPRSATVDHAAVYTRSGR